MVMRFIKLIQTIVFFLLIKIQFSFGQLSEIFVPANITMIDGSILEGYVKENDIIKMSLGILYKKELNDKKGRQILSKEIKNMLVSNYIVFDQQEIISDFMNEKSFVLAKKLVSGKANLYRFSIDGVDYFSIKKADSTYILRNDVIENGKSKRYYFQNYLKHALRESENNIKSYDNIKFKENEFIRIVSEYNLINGEFNKIYTFEKIIKSFIIGFIGGGKKGEENEFFGHLMYRIYFPKIDKNTSVNIGVNYFDSKFIDKVPKYIPGGYLSSDKNKLNFSYLSMPISVQQNFFSKKIRPYIFGGLSINYDLKDPYETSYATKKGQIGLQLNFGGGLELDLLKNILFKAEIREENYSHIINLGLGYKIKLQKSKK